MIRVVWTRVRLPLGPRVQVKLPPRGELWIKTKCLTYEEVLNIYKIIVICNPQKATISSLQQALLMIQEAQQPK